MNKEINEVVTKISGVDQPVSIWGDESCNTAPVRPLLYSLFFRLKVVSIITHSQWEAYMVLV